MLYWSVGEALGGICHGEGSGSQHCLCESTAGWWFESLRVLYQKMEPIWSHTPAQMAEIEILALDFMFKLLLDTCDQREECKTAFAQAKVGMGWS